MKANEISEKVKRETALQYIFDNPHDAAVIMATVLGNKAEKVNAGSLTYLLTPKREDNPVIYRMHVSCQSLKDRDKIDQQYFIKLRYLSSRNKLESMMMEAFRQFKHKLILHAEIDDLKKVYEDVLQEYKNNKGRAHIEFKKNRYYDENNIGIQIGDQIDITLVPVTGDFFYHRNTQVSGVCSVCGCTETNACYHPEYGACWWVNEEETLCSHCADESYPDSLKSRMMCEAANDMEE